MGAFSIADTGMPAMPWLMIVALPLLAAFLCYALMKERDNRHLAALVFAGVAFLSPAYSIVLYRDWYGHGGVWMLVADIGALACILIPPVRKQGRAALGFRIAIAFSTLLVTWHFGFMQMMSHID